jgi:nucleoside-diphosphate-sugar epimerase
MSELHVIFGTGAVGRAIMDELVKQGKKIRMVNRSGELVESPEGVEVFSRNLYDPEEVRDITQGARVVYQAAQPAYFEWPEKFPPLQQSIIDGLTGSSAKLVIVENFYMLGATNGTPMTEDMPPNPHTRKGKTRSEMSKAAIAAHREGKITVAIGRGSDFYGPWGLEMSTNMGSRQLYPLLEGKTVQIVGRTDIPHTYTYLKDFGRALVLLGDRENANGQVWNTPNDQPQITQGEMLEMFAEKAGVRLRISRIGKGMLRLVGLFSPPARELIEMMYEFEEPFIVDSSKFEDTFGMKATPIEEGITETLDWFISHPKSD